ISPSVTAQSFAAMANDSGARFLFVDAATAKAIEPVRKSIAAEIIGLDERALEGWLAPTGVKPRTVAIESHWPFNIIYSSGTTGAPKGIVQPHAMRWAHMQRGPAYGYDEEGVTLIATPLHSNTTLVSVFPTLALGGCLLLMAKFDAPAYLELAVKHRATHTILVPVQYQRLMARPDFDRYDLSAFRMKFSTSSPFAAALKADVLARWPGGLIEFYGMTEGGGSCVLIAHQHPDKLHTVGQPAPGHDVRVIEESGCELPHGEVGEVVGHSSGMMTGYHNQPGRTAEAEWFDPSGKRFIRTGDIGRFDSDGFLVLLDRKKDMIISGGFNVYPSDLEAVVAAHAEVAEVAVVGVPSARWGETPVAFVVPKAGATLDAGALLRWANERLGKIQRLAAVTIMETLPRNAIGKVLKRELREAYREKASAL
ncbi:MAG TPA: class I adenylate-forming enzyme family protein, partial [Usitatibacter sp.]|nr:class I adenylate-forming enzyme family protein [Usitatibacter sp.]